MEVGYNFYNSGMHLICIYFWSSGNRNVGLFRRISDGMYITARDTSQEKDGTYSWAWGHYFTDLAKAEIDYLKRMHDMLTYSE